MWGETMTVGNPPGSTPPSQLRRSTDVKPLPGHDPRAPGAGVTPVGPGGTPYADPQQKGVIRNAIFAAMAEGVAVLDGDFRVREINPAYTAMTGFFLSDVVGRVPRFIATPAPGLQEEIRMTAQRSGRWRGERWCRRKNGDEIAFAISITATTDGPASITHYLAIFTDVTQHKRDEQRLRLQASMDALTGLPNRSMLMAQLESEIASAQRLGSRLGVMLVDLDGFKLVNDTLGHQLGDELLQAVASRLTKAIRVSDLLTRFGGDEFIVIMPNVGTKQSIAAIAQRIVDSLGENFDLGITEASISASVGITVYPEDGATVQLLLQHATTATTRAKNTGKANFQFFNPHLDQLSPALLSMRTGLAKALERDEFELLYQPKANIATGKLTGVEALLRWRSPKHGLVMPGDFIPVLEESGMISSVGDWVMETACRQFRTWRTAGFGHIRVAVNLSVRQLRHGTLVNTVAKLLRRYKIDPSDLELEITETMIMNDTENAVVVLRQLSDMGVHLTMDDFGTGYSSLSYLKRFPQNTLKIDRSFVSDIATDPNDLEIARTVIQMGHSLGRTVVAEGVETEEQRLQLLQLGCDEMQGYLLSRPLSADDLSRMLASDHPHRFGQVVSPLCGFR